MISTCPNKNLPEWKKLAEAVGEREAMRDYMQTDGLIRSTEEVLAKLNENELPEEIFEEVIPELDLEEDIEGFVKIKTDVVYKKINVNKSFPGKHEMLRKHRIKKVKSHYYYVLNPTQQKNVDKYLRNPWTILGSAKGGFEIESDNTVDIVYKHDKGKGYLYIDEKDYVADASGIKLPTVVNSMRIPVQLVFNKEEKIYLEKQKKNELYVPIFTRELNKELFKIKGISAKKQANYYLLNLKSTIARFISNKTGNPMSFEELKNLTTEDADKIYNDIDIQNAINDAITQFKDYIGLLKIDKLRDEIHDLYSGYFDAKQLVHFDTLLNTLPQNFLKLIAFTLVDTETAFFRSASKRNKTKYDDLLKLRGIESMQTALSLNVALRMMVDDGVISKEDVDLVNEALTPDIKRFLDLKKKAPELAICLKPYLIRKVKTLKNIIKVTRKQLNYTIVKGFQSYIPRQLVDGEVKSLGMNDELVRFDTREEAQEWIDSQEEPAFAQVLENYWLKATEEVRKNSIEQNKGLVELITKISSDLGDFNTVFTEVTLGNVRQEGKDFTVDKLVIGLHELGHAVDMYLATTKPKTREGVMSFIEDLIKTKEFQNYIKEGLSTRGYKTSNKKEISADIFAWVLGKAIGYDMSNSHVSSLNDFFTEYEDLANSIFRKHVNPDWYSTIQKAETTTLDQMIETDASGNVVIKSDIDITSFMRDLLNQIIDAINELIGKIIFKKLTRTSQGIETTLRQEERRIETVTGRYTSVTETPVYNLGNMFDHLKKIILDEATYSIDAIMASTSQEDFNKYLSDDTASISRKLRPVSAKTKNTAIEQLLLDSGAIEWRNDQLFILKHRYADAINAMAGVNTVYGTDTVTKTEVRDTKGAGGRTIFKVVVNNPNATALDDAFAAFYRNSQGTLDLNPTANDKEAAFEMITKMTQQLGVPYKVIESEDAAKMLGEQWNGEPAFFVANMVYFVRDRFTTEMVLHEFAHPLMRAIQVGNPALFEKLFDEVSLTSEGQEVIDYVKKEYPNLEEGTTKFKEEVLVWSLQRAQQNTLHAKAESNPFVKFIKNLLYAIKQYLRSKFDKKGVAKKTTVQDLTVSTTLQELADMLVAGKNFDLTSVKVTPSDVAAFYKATREELEGAISMNLKFEDLQRLLNDLRRTAGATQGRMNAVNTREKYEELLVAIMNAAEGDEIKNVRRNLTPYTVNPKNPQEWREKLELLKKDTAIVDQHSEALATNLARLVDVATKMKDHIKELSEDINNKDSLNKVTYYDTVVKYWTSYLGEAIEILDNNNVDSQNPLYGLVSRINNTFKSIEPHIAKVKFNSTVETGRVILKPMIEWIDKYYGELIEKLEKAGAPKEAARMKKEWETQINPLKHFDKSVEGKFGDAGVINSFIESYMYSQDPVVAVLAKYVENHMIDVLTDSQAKANSYMMEIFPILEAAGFKPTKLGEFGELVGFLDKIFTTDEDGKPVIREAWAMLNPFQNTRLHIDELKHKIKKATEEAEKTGDFKKVDLLSIELDDEIRNNFNQKYIPVYYERFELFKDDIGMKARARMKAWQRNMQQYNDKYDTTSDVNNSVHEAARKAVDQEYTQLYALHDMNDEKKVGEELLISERLRDYRAQSRSFHEYIEREGVFQAKYMEFRESLLIRAEKDSSYAEGAPNYKIQMEGWIRRNTQKKATKEYEALVQATYKKIFEITSKLENAENFALLRAEITDIVNTHRDDAGIPNGQEIGPKLMRIVKANQKAINDLQKGSGKYEGIDADEKNSLLKYFEFLGELQRHQPTDYYVGIFNNYLSQLDVATQNAFVKQTEGDREMTMDNANVAIENKQFVDGVLLKTNEVFRNWFHRNHIEQEVYDERTRSRVLRWVRLKPWSQTVPASKEYMESREIRDENGKLIDTIEGLPAHKFFERKVIGDEEQGTGFFTKKVVGKTVTNRQGPNGEVEWLPLLPDYGAPADSKYINKKYFNMQAAYKRDPKSEQGRLFTALTKLTEYTLKFQENKANNAKLYLDFPMYEKSALETVREGRGAFTTAIKNIRARFVNTGDDIDLDFNPSDNIEAMTNIVKLDLFDSDVTYTIPMSGKYHIDKSRVSTDLPMGLMRYMMGLELNQKLLDISPIVRGLQDTVADNNPLQHALKQNKKNRSTGSKNKKQLSVREKAVNNYIEKVFEGKSMAQGDIQSKWVNTLSGAMFQIASTGFFALNISSALKNSLGAHFQSLIESVAGNYYDRVSLGKGTIWGWKAMTQMSATVYTKDVKPLDVQIIEVFDPEKARSLTKIGEQLSRTFAKDVADFSWLLNFRQWTQLESTLSIFGALMHYTKVEQIVDGTKRMIPYIEAWELKEGQLTLKEGIDKSWDKGGENFKKIVNLQHDINRKLQGAYAKEEQGELSRWLLGRWVLYLKKYFTTMFVDRWAFKGGAAMMPRYNIATDKMERGFYITVLKSFIRAVRNGNARLLIMDKEEKRAFLKLVTEVGMILAVGALYGAMFGWDPDDEDKWEKLKKKSGVLPSLITVSDPRYPFHMDGWLSNHALYLLMQIQAENEQWLPVPGMGLDNYVQIADLKSYALGPTIDNYTKALTDIYNMAAGRERAYYKRASGAYIWQQEGSAKIFNHLGKSVGLSSVQSDPILGIKYNLLSQQNPGKR